MKHQRPVVLDETKSVTQARTLATLAELLEMPERLRALEAQVVELREEMKRLVHGDPDQLLTTEDAAKLLGMTPAAVRQAAFRGTLPAERIGGGCASGGRG